MPAERIAYRVAVTERLGDRPTAEVPALRVDDDRRVRRARTASTGPRERAGVAVLREGAATEQIVDPSEALAPAVSTETVQDRVRVLCGTTGAPKKNTVVIAPEEQNRRLLGRDAGRRS